MISASGASVDWHHDTISWWTDQFQRSRAAYFPVFLEPRFGELLRQVCSAADFEEQFVEGVGKRMIEVSKRASGMLSLALRDRPLLEWLSQVAGRGELRSASGSIARLGAGGSHRLDWHDDRLESRRLAITIDLSTEAFEGGEFNMRAKGSETICYRHTPARFGSALIFHVDRQLEHRVSPVTAGGPRTTFSGWFLAQDLE
jgi:hypothetical protein